MRFLMSQAYLKWNVSNSYLKCLIKIRNYFDWKFELIDYFGDQRVMKNFFSHFHYPHDGRIYLVLAILKDFLICLLILFLRLFKLNLIDFDSKQFVLEFFVKRKHIIRVDFDSFWAFEQNGHFATRQWLQSSFQITFLF